jgi:choline dehydrogenase
MDGRGQEFDFVVVGGGTAGCVLAARLSEDPGVQVCLLEAGGAGKSPLVNVPGAIVLAQRSRELNWHFQSSPQVHLEGRRISLPRGRGLGGSALINGMVYFRGHPTDYDTWAKSGADGWSYREVLPYFLKSEDNESLPSSAFHARGGPMRIRNVRRPNPLNFAFIAALEELGLKAREDLTGADSEGVGLRQVAIRGGTRETSASAFLRPAMTRRNLTVMTGAYATRVILEGRQATAVECRLGDAQIRVQARREVILSAGTLQSPQLLMLSGIGDAEHLAGLGIAVHHHLPGVGRNLHDHLASPVHMKMEDPTSYGISWRAMPRNLANLAEYALFRRGPLANNIFESAAFIKSVPGLSRPDLQLVFQPAKRPSPSFPYPVGHGFAISPVALYPQSRGRVMLASADPFAAPLIDLNLLSVPGDLDPLIRAIRIIRRVFGARSFRKYHATETAPGSAAQNDADLAAYVRAQAYTVHHPVSSCRMAKDSLAVVDPQLRVSGLEGLRVVDASVFPSIIGGNTNAAVVMVAEKAADMIAGRPPLEASPIREPADTSAAGPAPASLAL